MKRIFILLTALWTINNATAQSCFPDGIVFSTQQQINSFRTSNPGCTQIAGNVTISGYNITNLNGLDVITSVGGSLMIECNESLASLAGLNNVTTVGGNLYVEGNMMLTNLQGLNGLAFVGGDVEFTDNIALVNLTGMEGLSDIHGRLWIDDNTALSGFTGLNYLVSVAGTVKIFSNSSLASLTGLESLTSIGGDLSIGGLGHLGSIGNPALASLQALSHVTSIGGDINIGYNPVLTSLAGLDNIDAQSVTGLTIDHNDTLSECEVSSICAYLSSPNGTVNISDNATGCNSIEEVGVACTLISLEAQKDLQRISFYPNPSSLYITIETPASNLKKHLTMLNFQAQQVLSYEFAGIKTLLDISTLPCGIYLVRITDDSSVFTGKLVRH
ncbi:MAG: T9SS type A sorting domain-containing protein [Bacteroidetes bacterium]|nr:T9SS type A sorting domain-containing protein [Bacteroidota bacterium]